MDNEQIQQVGLANEARDMTKKLVALSENGFQWLGDYEITADEVLGGIAPKANKIKQGISKRTLENAKKELGVRAKRINNTWYWELDKIGQ